MPNFLFIAPNLQCITTDLLDSDLNLDIVRSAPTRIDRYLAHMASNVSLSGTPPERHP